MNTSPIMLSIQECTAVFNVSKKFLQEVIEAELIKTETDIKNRQLIPESELTILEKLVEWHKVLDLNITGLEIMLRMSLQLKQMMAFNQRLLHDLQTLKSMQQKPWVKIISV